MPTIRHTLVALAAAVLTTAAFAQAAPDAAASAPDHHQRGARMAERFKAADANNDGKLTKDEAKSKMPMVYKHFDEIDVNHTGAVTMADIAAYAQAHRGARNPAATP
jgi:Ca2+-binding EF-hand superfamily protein